MDHLFSSVARVERMQLTVTAGRPVMAWAQATDDDPQLQHMLEWLPCRLDLNFIRPGKDQPPVPTAGRAPDRIGVMFCDPYAPIRAGDRIVTIPDEEGKEVVKGTFEIRVIPDVAVDYDDAHHIEVQVLETNQSMALVGQYGDDKETG